jgi:hypothetical protein
MKPDANHDVVRDRRVLAYTKDKLIEHIVERERLVPREPDAANDESYLDHPLLRDARRQARAAREENEKDPIDRLPGGRRAYIAGAALPYGLDEVLGLVREMTDDDETVILHEAVPSV